MRRAPLRIENARINNVEIPNSKKIEISLQYIFGIGQFRAQKILEASVRVESASVLQRCVRDLSRFHRE